MALDRWDRWDWLPGDHGCSSGRRFCNGGGLDEMDIMNQAEVIYDNSYFLSFVC